MPVTVVARREFEFIGTDLRGDPCIFSRDPRNHVFVQAFNFQTKIIDEREDQYLAFPQAMLLGGSIVGIYSDGPAHANSDRQIMFRSDDQGKTYQTVVFFEAATASYDFSLLVGLIPPGGAETFKVWTIRNIGGTLSATYTTHVEFGGLSYAIWSPVRAGSDGKFYRTGYANNGNGLQPAVFVSADKVTWSPVSVIMSSPGLNMGETDIVETSPGSWLAVCREDIGALNNLYYATSNDNMLTWSAASVYPGASPNGRQPHLTKLSDGSLLLATGDRSGGSGHGGSAGIQVAGFDTTGITVFRTLDMSGATWGFRTRVAPMYSTDGGQPTVVEVSPGRIVVIYYARRSKKGKPGIASALLDFSNL